LIEDFNYKTLILGHQLNDRLEWFFMELGKGAGIAEMVAMEEWEKREGFWIWRPFAFWSRREILEYLRQNKFPYSVDTSNFDLSYTRNFIRHTFSDQFLSLFEKGVKRSFHYLEKDKQELIPKIEQVGKCYFFPQSTPLRNLRGVDRIAKKLGVVMSGAQREELLRQGFRGVISGRVAVDRSQGIIFVAPFVKIRLGSHREKCRRLGIPPKIRGYVVKENLCDMLSTAISTAVWRSGRS
jgi:tRNA(Ile)-lysidine synthase